MMTPEEACETAIDLAGGAAAVAAHFTSKGDKLSVQAVDQWVRVPVNKCRAMAALINQQVTVFQMQPDVFGRSVDELKPKKKRRIKKVNGHAK